MIVVTGATRGQGQVTAGLSQQESSCKGGADISRDRGQAADGIARSRSGAVQSTRPAPRASVAHVLPGAAARDHRSAEVQK